MLNKLNTRKVDGSSEEREKKSFQQQSVDEQLFVIYFHVEWQIEKENHEKAREEKV